MDKAMMAMSLEEEDIPFDMPDLPEFSSCERNVLSLVGRTLNPDCQTMKHLIRDMPRKWQKIGRVRGIALSSEKFQFIFNSKHDLDEVLEKGVHTYNEWALAVERWVEHPPDNFLQFIPIWIQIWKLPINFYTAKAISSLADLIGQVKIVEFDPDKPQILPFVRVQVLFDVSRPLRRAKVVILPHGGTTSVHFEYERIQKRCYECQRLTHERDACPLFLKKKETQAEAKGKGSSRVVVAKVPFLKESDLLFGILEEHQVGINPQTGRQRIAPEVLEGMRQYVNVSNADERLVRIERIKKSVKEVESDPILAKSYLQLEPPPLVASVSSKPKGIVFSYGDQAASQTSQPSSSCDIPMPSSFFPAVGDLNLVDQPQSQSLFDPKDFLRLPQSSLDISTVYRTGCFATSSSGNIQKKPKQRKRPSKFTRKLKQAASLVPKEAVNIEEGLSSGFLVQQKTSSEGLSVVESPGAPILKLGFEIGGIVQCLMSIVSWNCQGLGRSQDLTIHRLKELRKTLFPEMLFVMETMHGRDVLVDLQETLGYDRVYTVEPEGKSGGLALFIKAGVTVDLRFVDKNLLDFHVQFGAVSCFVSCIYGDPIFKKRLLNWERMSRIGVGRRDPWCIVGDFNDILHNGEKTGGSRRSENVFKPFSDMLTACNMVELPGHGNSFTWAGRRYDLWIQSRLDRSFGNKEWFSLFPVSNQSFLDLRGSDHRPVLIKLTASQDRYRGQFRFDKRLLFKPDVEETIFLAWNSTASNRTDDVAQRLRVCRKALSSWKKTNNLNSKDKINQLENALEVEQSTLFPRFLLVYNLKRDLALAYNEEEEYWRQKSKDKWMHSGDRNTGFFHASVKNSRAKKRIDLLLDVNGNEQKSEGAKGEVASAYFNSLFSSANPASFNHWFFDFPSKVTAEMNNSLILPVTKEEVKEAMFSIKPSSAPGPDGMSALFFQHYWYIVGDQVVKEVQLFFLNGDFPEEWNYTHLCLIPKVPHPTEMKNLRPISLCSVLYKVISKILVKRLKPLLPGLVSDSQSAFVADRLISDNIVVAHEIVHSLNSKPVFAAEYMTVKTDMSKAFDRVEWSYLRSLLLALGFHLKWVNWVMKCVSSVTFSVLINDVPHGMIKPQRGLRQGDPLSPFLFVLCTEGLTHLLNRAHFEGKISGFQFHDNGPAIHHLLFADDSLFMCKANQDQALELLRILTCYGKATGQELNLAKSSITFGAKVLQENKDLIKAGFGIYSEGGAGTYLGLPECFSGSKVELLSYIKERLKSKLSGWYARTLSLGGKEVLLKSVAMAMPVFAMSCFRLPKTTCENLSSAMAAFWWSSQEHERKIHWLSWEKLCLSKDLGGLGFKDIALFNQALLAKQAWRLIQHPHCLFAKFLKHRYYPLVDFLDAVLGSRPSFAWRSILFGRDLLIKGLQKRVGNGNSIKVWMEPWLDDGIMRIPWIKNPIIDLELSVSDLIDFERRDWDPQKLDEHFFPDDIIKIKRRKPVVDLDDFFVWKHNKNGDFSVKSAYWLACEINRAEIISQADVQPSINTLKAQVWKLTTDPKIKVFLWKALSGALGVTDQLQHRGMKLDGRCQACGFEGESINHVLFECSVARQIWAMSDYPSPENGFNKGAVFSNIHHLLVNRDNKSWPSIIRKSFPWILWRIWKNRNLLFFEGKSFDARQSVIKIQEDVNEWFSAQRGDVLVEPPSRDLISSTDGFVASAAQFHSQLEPLPIWKPPLSGWLKCNVGVSWSKRKGIIWQDVSMIGVILRPIAWPSFRYESIELLRCLGHFLEWSVVLELPLANRGAYLLAQSVTSDCRLNSYVASSYPTWLYGLFECERLASSV
ncbi:Reverse transcriptase domain [Arabidopsis suecica]|uniref:Reverse transcriptase domain n=1 Tax=Arabidopsis suecica TaxID=45249 RepID=A0A8T1ZYS4_ARASU|nr:Reverse transcriptase domain [Arabidopsis suecica]